MALSLEEGGLSWRKPTRAARTGEAPVALAPTVGVNEAVWQPGSGFRNTGAFREKAMQTAQLGARSAEVGEPTSFRGGVGAPEPIAVMRGTATTFSPGRLPGNQFAEPEMATPLQARQAYIQGTEGPRGFKAPGQTLKEATPGEAPGKEAEALGKGKYFTAAAGVTEAGQAKVDQAKVISGYDTLMHESPYSTFDTKTGKTIFKAKDESQYRDYLAGRTVATQSNDQAAGRKHFNESQKIRQWLQTQPLAPGTNVDALLDAARQNPAYWQGMVQDAQKSLGMSHPAPAAKTWYGLPEQQQGPLKPAFSLPPATETVPPM